jgi:hypothetical protein
MTFFEIEMAGHILLKMLQFALEKEGEYFDAVETRAHHGEYFNKR